MIISSLIVTLAALDSPAADAIRSEPKLDIGNPIGRQLPLVVETETAEESQRMHDWLWSLPGVNSVDVVFVQFAEQQEASHES